MVMYLFIRWLLNAGMDCLKLFNKAEGKIVFWQWGGVLGGEGGDLRRGVRDEAEKKLTKGR